MNTTGSDNRSQERFLPIVMTCINVKFIQDSVHTTIGSDYYYNLHLDKISFSPYFEDIVTIMYFLKNNDIL